MSYSDEELLVMVADERRRSIGFDTNVNGSDLQQERQKALEYRKGQMDDIASLPNRSTAVSTDVDEAIETILPDLIDILSGGEDVVTFRPHGEEDEKAAEQETDYLKHVVFNENDGWMILYTMCKDALQVKTGVVTWYDEEYPEPEPDEYRGMTQAQVALVAQQRGDPANLRASEQEGTEPLYDFEVPKPKRRNKLCIAPVPPEDFTVAADTVRLPDTTYCAMRYRPRAQALLAQGVDPDIVESLPQYGSIDDTTRLARDTAGEHESGTDQGGQGDLRIVEVVAHYIRVYEDGEMKIYRIRTGSEERVFIDKVEVDSIRFAAITPFIVTHRFYGESIADKLMEIQRIKTALTRISLDSAYYALNQRYQVDMSQANENTIPDLLSNQPGSPIRTKGNAVTPLSAGALNFDPFHSLEYFNTVAEQRSGVVRNAQGLNPDTLHDTAKGAMALMGAAKKRIRMIARIFAETGIKDMYLGVHALLRQGGGQAERVRLRNEWVQIDPTQWGERNDMSIEIGVGSGGREQDLAMIQQIIGLQAQAVTAQGGSLQGPLVNADNLYNSAVAFVEKSGGKAPEKFFSDPSKAQAPAAPQPDPHAMAAMASAQHDQATLQLEGQKAMATTQNDQAKLALEAQKLELDKVRLQLEAEDRAHARQMSIAQFQADQAQAERDRETENALKLAEINARYQTQVTVAQIKADAEQLRTHADLAIQASEHQHGMEMQAQTHIKDLIAEAAQPAPEIDGEGQ